MFHTTAFLWREFNLENLQHVLGTINRVDCAITSSWGSNLITEEHASRHNTDNYHGDRVLVRSVVKAVFLHVASIVFVIKVLPRVSIELRNNICFTHLAFDSFDCKLLYTIIRILTWWSPPDALVTGDLIQLMETPTPEKDLIGVVWKGSNVYTISLTN